MAITDFFRNARAVTSVLAEQLDTATANPPEATVRLLAGRQLWLTPEAVAGYDPDDFRFLPPDEQDRLAAAVEHFRAAAAELSGREPTADEVFHAAGLWTDLFKPLREYVSDPEGLAIIRALLRDEDGLPGFVLGLDYALDTDATGDQAIWIWVIIDDAADAESSAFQEFARRFRARVRKALQAQHVNRIPYVRFRPRSEFLAGLHEAAA